MPRTKSVDPAPARPHVTAVVKRSEIIARRLANPMAGGSLAIPAAHTDREGQPLVVFRIVNAEVSSDHLWRTKHVKGWEYAEPQDIKGPPTDFGFELRDGRLVRGVRGTEVLMKMLRVDYLEVQASKETYNRRQALGQKETRQAIVERASRDLEGESDEAANFLQRSLSNVQITDTRERLPPDAGD